MAYAQEQATTPHGLGTGAPAGLAVSTYPAQNDVNPFFGFNVPGSPFASPARQPGASGGMPLPVHCSPPRTGHPPVASPARSPFGPLGSSVVQQYGDGTPASDARLDDSQFGFGDGIPAPSFWNPALMTPGGGMDLEVLPDEHLLSSFFGFGDGADAAALLDDGQPTAAQNELLQQLATFFDDCVHFPPQQMAEETPFNPSSLFEGPVVGEPHFGVVARVGARQVPPAGTNPSVMAAAMLALQQYQQQTEPLTPACHAAAEQLLQIIHQADQQQTPTAGEAGSPGSSTSGGGLPSFRGSPNQFRTPPQGPHLPVLHEPPAFFSAHIGPNDGTPPAPRYTVQGGSSCRRALFKEPPPTSETPPSAH